MAYCFTEQEILELKELEHLLMIKQIPHIRGEDICQAYQKGECQYGPWCTFVHCKSPNRMKSIVCIDTWLLGIDVICNCDSMHSSFYEDTLSTVAEQRLEYLQRNLN